MRISSISVYYSDETNNFFLIKNNSYKLLLFTYWQTNTFWHSRWRYTSTITFREEVQPLQDDKRLKIWGFFRQLMENVPYHFHIIVICFCIFSFHKKTIFNKTIHYPIFYNMIIFFLIHKKDKNTMDYDVDLGAWLIFMTEAILNCINFFYIIIKKNLNISQELFQI